MKLIIIFSLFSTIISAAENKSIIQKEKKIGAPPNAVSRGQSESAGISDSPTGTTKKEAQEYRTRTESMGGAPNVGAGMGTGTGAGSTVGQELDDED